MASPEIKVAAGDSRELPVLEVASLDNPFTAETLSRLAALLPEFIAPRRWYRSKARQIQAAEIADVIPVGDAHQHILITQIRFADGGADEYILALGLVSFGEAKAERIPDTSGGLIATYRTGNGQEGHVYDAFSDSPFRGFLLKGIADETTFYGKNGELIASHTSAFGPACQGRPLELESTISKAEQSNTSIIYGDRFILKLFRKLEQGINPDVEIGVFLTEHGFKNTPAVLGSYEYRKPGNVYGAGILQEFVRNQGDAWKYTLEALAAFFKAALKRDLPAPIAAQHPLELMSRALPPDARELLGGYADSAHLLGVRTAQMHIALADPSGGADFLPEPFTPADGAQLHKDLLSQADITFELLRRKRSMLTHPAAQHASTLLASENRLPQRFSSLANEPVTAARIRFHGDFHLGQVLYTGSDFMIIDFEGEPARPLTERRAKGLALRDVAGMVRSFQYAAYAALFGQVPGLSVRPESMSAVEDWAAFWTAWVSATYLNGYFSAAGALPFVPASAEQTDLLLDAFLLQKALYEVAYELNNRPDWVSIPLRGIASLVS